LPAAQTVDQLANRAKVPACLLVVVAAIRSRTGHLGHFDRAERA
jgi:hypothetical protein